MSTMSGVVVVPIRGRRPAVPAATLVVLAFACADAGRPMVSGSEPHLDMPPAAYSLERVFEVEGRQGIATDGDRYVVSGSTALYVYSRDGELLKTNVEPFSALAKRANHIGDIDVYDGEIYAGIEWFVDGLVKDIQIAVYDADTLAHVRSIDWSPESGQLEVSGAAVDPAAGVVWMTDWVDGEHVYRYDLTSGRYAGKLRLRPVPSRQQGIAFSRGHLFVTADDGDADLGEPDSLWRLAARPEDASSFVKLEKIFVELRRAGEIEGVTFDDARGEMAVLSNRGARIVQGMPVGLYPGYEREIHEVYVYKVAHK